ncbi:MAG TPA: hypothetical protein VKB70_03215 [Gaiellaceae bacterium]|nr:hypothetical protein [Gaiellaceae bacterium]
MSRLHLSSKAPLAVAGILAVPIFFVALLAFGLKFDKPSHTVGSSGKLVLGDPTKGTLGTIYLLAFAVAIGVVLVGLLASLLRVRLSSIVPAISAIVAAILLIAPLGSWAAQHTARYPLGVDNIPKSSPQDLSLRGEWEQSTKSTARQIGLTTIGIAIAAIVLAGALEVRRRRGRHGYVPPPPPAISGVAEISPAVELELADSDLVRGGRPGRWRWR